VIKHYYEVKNKSRARLEANYCNVVYNIIELGTCLCVIFIVQCSMRKHVIVLYDSEYSCCYLHDDGEGNVSEFFIQFFLRLCIGTRVRLLFRHGSHYYNNNIMHVQWRLTVTARARLSAYY